VFTTLMTQQSQGQNSWISRYQARGFKGLTAWNLPIPLIAMKSQRTLALFFEIQVGSTLFSGAVAQPFLAMLPTPAFARAWLGSGLNASFARWLTRLR
jgi:hypothetical protein